MDQEACRVGQSRVSSDNTSRIHIDSVDGDCYRFSGSNISGLADGSTIRRMWPRVVWPRVVTDECMNSVCVDQRRVIEEAIRRIGAHVARDDARWHGYAIGEVGGLRNANPHSTNEAVHEAWDAGWVSGHNSVLAQRPGVGVGVFVASHGHVLLGKRNGSHGDGCWAIIGGNVEYDESLADAMRRELREETGIITDAYIGVYDTTVFTRFTGTRAYASFYGVVRIPVSNTASYPATPQANREFSEFRWVTKHDIRQMSPLFAPLKTFLDQGGIINDDPWA